MDTSRCERTASLLDSSVAQLAMDSQNDNSMQYAHIPRDDSNGSTPFQTHQSLNQALGSHLAPPQYARTGPDAYRHPSNSPPTLSHAGPSAHQGITFAVTTAPPSSQASPALKRKQMDPQLANANGGAGTQLLKRRKDGDDDAFDDGAGQGAKHWTDDEKTKLFRWLMGPSSDDHWASLRATKNSCLRECAEKVFDRKKSYQALKGCYERNFNLFKQIYALDAYHNHSGAVLQSSEAERLREYERRLQNARKGGCDVGNITSRTIEHWFSRGWYELFFRRWHGDPATTRPIQTRSTGGGGSVPQGTDDQEDEDPSLDFPPSDSNMMVNGLTNGLAHDRQQSHQVTFINPQTLSRDIGQQQQQQLPQTPATAPGQVTMVSPPTMHHSPPAPATSNSNHHIHHHPNTSTSAMQQQPPQPQQAPVQVDPASAAVATAAAFSMPLPFPPQAANAFMQYLQTQTQLNKMKMEYMRRREEREEKEHRTKYETGRLQLEKEKIELEEKKSTLLMKQKSEKAIELLGRPEIDGSVKAAASEYLRKLFAE